MKKFFNIKTSALVLSLLLILGVTVFAQESTESTATPAPKEDSHPTETVDPAGCPLPPQEYRLLQCLLYGQPLDWIRQEGLMLSVLTDSINDILFDTFSDTVLASDDPPELIEDYINDLKAMVKP